MGSDKPRTFAELVDALDPEERARLERRESFDDPAVRDGGLTKVTVFEDRHGSGEWHVEYNDDNGDCYVTVFAGPEAERRAQGYFAALKTGQLLTIRAVTIPPKTVNTPAGG
jgi:hypothetical protein